ncbi:MAG: insulinase family protein, partial [Pseudomonadales bacterium]|nr:insulinase family protein [Pseudomonadales bacterium]
MPLSVFFVLSLSACSSTSLLHDDAASIWGQFLDTFIADDTHNSVRQSPDDSRRYQYFTLDNQLKVLLISDDNAEKSAASLDVHVGSRYDPKARQGLAHFLEHMLFLGTKKYPEADGYQKFISENGGSHNAYTSFEHTNYYFDIDNASLAPALDRFADFFVSPLFDANYVQREVNAVESEYRAKIKDENRRILDATRQLINPEHPYHQFTVGGLTTLSSPSIRDDMLDFYQRYYSASRMTLVVVGDYPLSALKAMVVNRFASIPNNDSQTETINVPLLTADNNRLPLILAVQAEKPIRQLRLTFPMPDLSNDFRTKPLSYIGNILGHEGKGSLLSLLKAAGWAEGLGTGVGLSYTGGATFQINIALTAKGVKAFQQVTDEVFFAIQYLGQQHKQNPQLSRALFIEQRQLADMAFRFYQRPSVMSAAMGAAANLHFYPPAEVISGDYDYSEYRPELIADRLARMTADNVLITLISKDVAQVVAKNFPDNVKPQKISPWFAAPYSVNDVPQAWLEKWQGDLSHTLASQSFTLPAANTFIAKDFELFSAMHKSDVPTLMVDKTGMRLWVKTDDTFEVPKVDALFSFLTASSRQTSRHAALSQLYASVVNEQLNEYLYPAYLAGMNVGFYSQRQGFTLSLGGYNDGLIDLAEKVLPTLTTLEINPDRFDSIKAELMRAWQLSRESTPYRRLASTMQQALYANSWSEVELIDALADVTLADLQQHVDSLWPSIYTEGLLHGNVDSDTITALTKQLEVLPNCGCDLTEQRLHMGVVKLPLGRQQQEQTLNHSDAAVLWYFQAPDQSLSSAALSQLTVSILHPRLFNQLRTEQQLGYVVGASAFNRNKLPGIAFQVQSPSSNEQEILTALNGFIDDVLEHGVDIEEFNRHRQALSAQLREADQNLTDRSRRFWGSLVLADEAFERRERLAEIVDDMTYDDWLAFVRALLSSQEASLIQLTHS